MTIGTQSMQYVVYTQGADLSEDWTGDWQQIPTYNDAAFSLSWDSPDLDMNGTMYFDLAIGHIGGLGGGQFIVDWYHTPSSLMIASGVQPDTTALWLIDPIWTACNCIRLRYVADSEDPGTGTLDANFFAKSRG